jgi:formylglycine-generating enzyme required for sulfatase activity
MRHTASRPFIVFTLLAAGCAGHTGKPRESVNSLGMTLVRIAPGSFDMGVDSVPLPPELTKGVSGASWDRPDGNGDYDEVPVHRVTLTQPLLIGQTEVTVEQFRQFRPDYQPNDYWSPYASGVSWNDAWRSANG